MLFLTLVAATSDLARALGGHDLEQYADDEFCSQACNGACYGACYGLESQFDVLLGLVGGGGGDEEDVCEDLAGSCDLGTNKQTTKACKDDTVKDTCKVTCKQCDMVESLPPTPAPPMEPVAEGGSCVEMCAGKCDEVCMGGEHDHDGMDGMDGSDDSMDGSDGMDGMDGMDGSDDDMDGDDDDDDVCEDIAGSCDFANNKQATKQCKDDTVKDTCKVTCKQCGRRLTSSLTQFI